MADNTKRALVASLKKQLTQKPLGKITISDITADAGVNRMTFYYHFHDIYELVEWAFKDEVFKSATNKVYSLSNWQEGVLDVFHVFLKNKSFVMNVYRSINREQVENHLIRGLSNTLGEALKERLSPAGISEGDQAFIIHFYIYGCTGMIFEWMNHDMKEDPSDIVSRFSKLIRSGLGGILEKYNGN